MQVTAPVQAHGIGFAFIFQPLRQGRNGFSVEFQPGPLRLLDEINVDAHIYIPDKRGLAGLVSYEVELNYQISMGSWRISTSGIPGLPTPPDQPQWRYVLKQPVKTDWNTLSLIWNWDIQNDMNNRYLFLTVNGQTVSLNYPQQIEVDASIPNPPVTTLLFGCVNHLPPDSGYVNYRNMILSQY